MALIELAATPFGCSQVVLCLGRDSDAEDSQALLKSLRWVGCELITLAEWDHHTASTSEKWLLLGMEI
jgi:hypothetical protein